MKHIKLFENKNDELWIVINIPTGNPSEYTIEIFDDMQSAQNNFVELVNDIAKDNAYHNDEDIDEDNYDDVNYIFTVEEAEQYVKDEGYVVEYKNIFNRGTWILPEELKLGRETKKYNI